MRVLVIPDCHLKPWMFDAATKLMEQADMAVCLGDLVDDFGKETYVNLYQETMDNAIRFSKDFPNTRWCWGNHDVAYVWGKRVTGTSNMAFLTVWAGLYKLIKTKQLAFVHNIDGVLFSHAGLSDNFVSDLDCGDDLDDICEATNEDCFKERLWADDGPLWVRPQITGEQMLDCKMQVVGHTPMETVHFCDGILSVDVFSTNVDGSRHGEERFVIVDTEKGEWRYAN